MVTRCVIKPQTYRDSVELMDLSAALRSLAGIRQAVAIMGTERNKATLEASGLLVGEAAGARPDDLLLVIQGENEEAVSEAVAHLERLLAKVTPRAVLGGGGERHPRSLGRALQAFPAANLALISVPGIYAAAEAVKALRAGLHVQIFSDNVTLEEEVALKRLGQELGLLVMGPDCGTSLINGVPLGFANIVARGSIGLIGASGTGIQEVSVLIHRLGAGISHAIGTGGRDLTEEVGGLTTLQALHLLDEDPATGVIVLISKFPGPRTAEKVLAQARALRKPVVVNFLGHPVPSTEGVFGAVTLEEAAAKAVALAKGESPEGRREAFPRADAKELAGAEAAQKVTGQRYLRALYSGGTLAEEAIYILETILGGVFSNVAPLRAEYALPDPRQSRGHSVVDLGDDEFTRGRPHPMIDLSYRAERLVAEASDPEVAVLLFDVVLGFGAHPNPAGVLVEAIRTARAVSGRHLTFVASVCGTEADPQVAERQTAILKREEVIVLPSNAYAAEVAGEIARRCMERGGI